MKDKIEKLIREFEDKTKLKSVLSEYEKFKEKLKNSQKR